MNNIVKNERVRINLLISLLLVLAVLMAYIKVGSLDFLDFDDPLYVTGNRMVKNGLTVEGLVWAFKTFHGSNWHPLTWLSHMLDCQLYGLNPAGHHWTSLQLHIANSLLLFFILQQMTGALWRSAFVAALFAVHPLNVESVAWVAQRKNVLSTFFALLTILGYHRYVKKQRLADYLLAFVCLSLGLTAKPMLVTLPFVLLLLDFWPLNRLELGLKITEPSAGEANIDVQTLWVRIREKIPFFFLIVLSSAWTIVSESSMGAVKSLDAYPLSVRILNALAAYCRYLIKAVVPVRLSFFYPHQGSNLPVWQGLAAALVIAGISLGVIRASKRYRYPAVGWFWFLGTLVPVIGLVQIGHQSMADRYAYVPMIGIFILTAWGAYDMAARWRMPKFVLALAAGGVLTTFMTLTWFQVCHWQSSYSLARHALKVTSENWVAHYGIGNVLRRRGKPDEAARHYSEALRINPDYANAHNDLGTILARQGRVDLAVYHYKEALRLKPDYSKAHNNIGAVMAGRNKVKAALYHFNAALKIDPENVDAHANLATLLAAQGQPDKAILHYRKALEVEPDNVAIHDQLGKLFIRQSRYKEALSHFLASVRIEPGHAAAYNEIGIILAFQGKYDQAQKFFQKAIQLNPADQNARQNLKTLKQAMAPKPATSAYITE